MSNHSSSKPIIQVTRSLLIERINKTTFCLLTMQIKIFDLLQTNLEIKKMDKIFDSDWS